MPEMESAEKAAGMLLENELAAIPNLPAADTPDGKDEHDNVELRRFGAPPRFPNSFVPKEHFEIGEALGLMDFETAAKLSGARFVVLKGALARLERALMQFMLDLHTGEHGYEEVNPPVLVRDAAMFGTAQLPNEIFAIDQFARRQRRLHGIRSPRQSAGESPTRPNSGTDREVHAIRADVDEAPAAALYRRHALLPRRGGRGGKATPAA